MLYVIGAVVLLVAINYGDKILAFVKKKAPVSVSAISSGKLSRLEAMQHADKLLTHFEEDGDKLGADSVRSAITSIWEDKRVTVKAE